VIAHFFWDEPLNAGKLAAIALILAGVALLHRV
jgi:multidrug transporter EmrE-like cation transporter